MLAAKIPECDPTRVASLKALNVLDTAAEERFDRLTRLALRLFDVPMALVSLVDEDRQWFKSSQGLNATETPRDISFCGHVVYDSCMLVVNDTQADPRFADNPLVTGEPHIRFYTGYPLKDANGLIMGTLCIIDTKPREFSSTDRDTLKDLAEMAERELVAIQLATVDELTGLSNRRGFSMLAEKSLKYSVRHAISASLVFVDLNKFKAINDDYGHAEGDKALIVFSDIMKKNFRSCDIFGRLGGDEFVALLMDADESHARSAVAHLQNAVDRYNKESNAPYSIEFSMGIVQYNPFRHGSLEELLAAGDRLMYHDKRK